MKVKYPSVIQIARGSPRATAILAAMAPTPTIVTDTVALQHIDSQTSLRHNTPPLRGNAPKPNSIIRKGGLAGRIFTQNEFATDCNIPRIGFPRAILGKSAPLEMGAFEVA
jgi:hypothetical protein